MHKYVLWGIVACAVFFFYAYKFSTFDRDFRAEEKQVHDAPISAETARRVCFELNNTKFADMTPTEAGALRVCRKLGL